MRIELVYSPGPRQVCELTLTLDPGSTARGALVVSGWIEQFPALLHPSNLLSIWGRTVAQDAVLKDGDRLEVCRALRVDPKVARRERFKDQGARGTGLFAQRRPGSKAGY